MSLSNQENAVRDLKTLHGKRDNYVFSGRSTEKILKQIEQLQEQINKKNYALFTGKFIYCVL